MAAGAEATWARCVNLVMPGGGLILLGRVSSGVLIGLLFAVSANLAVWTTLLVPDNASLWVTGLCVGVSGGTYLGAQLRLTQTVRAQQRAAAAAARRQALRDVRAHIQAGDTERALLALEPIAAQAEYDLFVAYRLAQVLTMAGDARGAHTVWQWVRRLDTDRLYGDEARRNEQTLRRELIASGEADEVHPKGP
ncbi:MAG: hypothetical protein KKB50_20605 [Planctomycetes bacterium]|nr:hypothetical protein [Planctomycetota bacterium]